MAPSPRPLAGVRPADGQAVEALIGWLDRSGACLPKLAVEIRAPEGRGVYARAPIAAGEEILRIPPHAIMTLEGARRSAIGRALGASGAAAGDDSMLAAFLLQEKHDPGSFFRPYLDMLPEAFPHNPLFYDDAHAALLSGSLLVDLIAERRRAYHRDYTALAARVPEFARFSEAEFVWARLAVLSRNFGLTIEGTRTRALVPMLDLLNHALPAETTWSYDDTAGAVLLHANRAFPAGAPVHDSYGAKCNRRYLLNYGFTVDDNPDDEASLRLHLPAGDPFHAAKHAALQMGRGETSRTFLLPFRPDREGAAMLSFLRIAVADREDLAALSGPGHALHGDPVSTRNEAAALAALSRACEEALARFPTTAEEDDRLLQDPRLDVDARNAVRMRRGEKRVLGEWIALCRFAAPLLDRPWSALAGMARKRDAGWGRFDGYVRAGVIPAVANDPWRALEGAARRGPRPLVCDQLGR